MFFDNLSLQKIAKLRIVVAMADIIDFLSELNPEQYQAVTTTEGPLLVLSGAGTGKTRVLTTRVGYILAQHLALPWQILAVTFTNKAAKEMGARLEQMVGQAALGTWLGTFHRIGVKILRRYGGYVGLQQNFAVLDADDQERLLKNLMQQYIHIDFHNHLVTLI